MLGGWQHANAIERMHRCILLQILFVGNEATRLRSSSDRLGIASTKHDAIAKGKAQSSSLALARAAACGARGRAGGRQRSGGGLGAGRFPY